MGKKPYCRNIYAEEELNEQLARLARVSSIWLRENNACIYHHDSHYYEAITCSILPKMAPTTVYPGCYFLASFTN